jgi:hypothetical protein
MLLLQTFWPRRASPARKRRFYELFVDYGEGPVNFGLYTMIEVIDDTVIDRVFGDDDGNIYEADGPAVFSGRRNI